MEDFHCVTKLVGECPSLKDVSNSEIESALYTFLRTSLPRKDCSVWENWNKGFSF